MNAALTSHPEWTGDWQMPEGVQQAEIDPATGQLAKAEAVNKRAELFINGTLPGSNNENPVDEMAEQPPAEGDGEAAAKNPEMEPATLPGTPPSEPARARPTPKGELRIRPDRDLYDGDSSSKLQGTVTLDIDPTTGLIAVIVVR